MSFIRLVTLADLDSLVELASESTFGLTTLRPDRDRLRKRIEESDTGEAPLLVTIDESADPELMTESYSAFDELTNILGLGSIYDFQK